MSRARENADGARGISPTFTGKVTTPSIVLTPSSAPGSPAEGELYYDSTSDIIKTYDGSTFKGLTSEGVAGLTVQGGTITDYTTLGVDYRVHTFYSSGIFNVYSTKNMDVLIVGGGGGGGGRMAGGGAGGAYFYTTSAISVKAGTYNIVVGGGGAGGSDYGIKSGQGGSSLAFGVEATGGGGGKGRFDAARTTQDDLQPANGGGGSYSDTAGIAGTSLSATGWTYNGGYAGGAAEASNGTHLPCGGGGGAKAVGVSPSAAGAGGAGGIGSQDCDWVTPDALGIGGSSNRWLEVSGGTASQSGTTVTGSGTAFSTNHIGKIFQYADGTSSGLITARASDTSITVTTSQTVGSQAYIIKSPYYFSGGGGGSQYNSAQHTTASGAGGKGGGGGGSTTYQVVGLYSGYDVNEGDEQKKGENGLVQGAGGSASMNSGGGGGGDCHPGHSPGGGKGGSGIVVIRYVR